MIDTHAHLNTDAYDMDLIEVLNRSKKAGIKKTIVIGMDEVSNHRAIELSKQYDQLYASVGIHPSYVDQAKPNAVSALKELTKHEKVIAVGECGIDLYWTKDNLDKQKSIFKEHIDLAVVTKLPLIIHMRSSFNEIYDMLLPYRGLVGGVFHCFSSTYEDAKKAMDLGFYIGIDGPITYKKNEDLQDIIKHMDIHRLLLETDSPYLSPVPFRGKRNEPSYLGYIAKKIAEIRQITVDELIDITTQNTIKLFNLGGNI